MKKYRVIFSPEMVEKYRAYIKNMGSGSVASVIGGLAGSYITELFSSSPGTIATVSTASQYIASIPTFSVLHARYNGHLYTDDEENFLWKPFLKDVGALNTALLPLDYVYVPVRAYLNYWFQSKGFDPYSASFFSDFICIPLYVVASIPIAKSLGIIKSEDDDAKELDSCSEIIR